jgi:hypothetical protein
MVVEIRTAIFRHVASDYMASIDQIKVPTEISMGHSTCIVLKFLTFTSFGGPR